MSSFCKVQLTLTFNPTTKKLFLPHKPVWDVVVTHSGTGLELVRVFADKPGSEGDYTLNATTGELKAVYNLTEVVVEFKFFAVPKLVNRLPLVFSPDSCLTPDNPIYKLSAEYIPVSLGVFVDLALGVDYLVNTQTGVITKVSTSHVLPGGDFYVSYMTPVTKSLYITPQEFIESYGYQTTVELTNPDDPQSLEPNYGKLATAIQLMSGEIDMYLDGHYQVPIDPPTQGIKWKCGVMVRYHLDQVRPSEDLRKRFEDVLTQLKLIATGKINTGAPDDVPDSNLNPSVLSKPGLRIFTPTTLAGYF